MASEKTTNYQLNKWLGKDKVLASEFNDNFDTLDSKLKEVETTAANALAAAGSGGGGGGSSDPGVTPHKHSGADIASGVVGVEYGGTGQSGIDKTPTAESQKMVTSGGVKAALDTLEGKITAATETAEAAKSAAEGKADTTHTHTTLDSSISVGSATEPIYFAKGVPTKITKVGSATKADSADVATKLGSVDAGDTTHPIYLAKGVPTQVDKVAAATTADIATTATTATKLGSETVGSTGKPIYLLEGVPTEIENVDAAATASKLGSADVGSVNQPIYLLKGTATVITALGTAYGGTGQTSVDSTPTTSSPKMVTSGGVRAALDALDAKIKGIGGGIKLKGSCLFSELESKAPLGADSLGFAYTVTDEFTTTESFAEGAGHKYSAGATVVVVEDGEGIYKYAVYGGIVDLSAYALKSEAYKHPTGDGNLHVPATSTTSENKVLTAGATAGSISWGHKLEIDVPSTAKFTDTTYNDVTSDTHGLMLAADKKKLDTMEIATDAEVEAMLSTVWPST